MAAQYSCVAINPCSAKNADPPKSPHTNHYFNSGHKWWNGLVTLPLRDAVLGMEGREGDLPDLLIEIDHVYSDTSPVFFGHYWLKGDPHITALNAQCLDFSVAKGGYLSAYRWSGEVELKQENLVWC